MTTSSTGADHRRPAAEVEDAVDRVDQRIELVRAEQDRDLEVVAHAARDFDHALLMRRVERDQRLVEQQQARPADQRLAQEHELALAARQFADRPPGELARADLVERPVDLAPRRLVERTKPKRPPIAALATTSQPVSLRPAIAPRFCGM